MQKTQKTIVMYIPCKVVLIYCIHCNHVSIAVASDSVLLPSTACIAAAAPGSVNDARSNGMSLCQLTRQDEVAPHIGHELNNVRVLHRSETLRPAAAHHDEG